MPHGMKITPSAESTCRNAASTRSAIAGAQLPAIDHPVHLAHEVEQGGERRRDVQVVGQTSRESRDQGLYLYRELFFFLRSDRGMLDPIDEIVEPDQRCARSRRARRR